MNPIDQFLAWHAEALAGEASDANAMALATSTAEGRPSVRMVLYRGLSAGRVRFFTNQQSRKGQELDANPWCAAVFSWPGRGRQVRIEGGVQRLDDRENDAYFASRPHGHQVAALVSAQSRPVSRPDLDAAFGRAAAFYEQLPVPRPNHWGGYGIVPDAFEFWQSADNRLHHRQRYEKRGPLWTAQELAP